MLLPPADGMRSPAGVLFAGVSYPIALGIIRWLTNTLPGKVPARKPFSPGVWSVYAIAIVLAAKFADEAARPSDSLTLVTFAFGVAALTLRPFVDVRNISEKFPYFDAAAIRIPGFVEIPAKIWGSVRVPFSKVSAGAVRFRKLILAIWLAALIVATVVTLRVIWAGPVPDVFISPDESNSRVGAELVASTGSPVLNLPFEDGEDLAHPRFWVSRGPTAVSPHPPMIFYLNGYPLMTGPLGTWFPYFLAGVGVAALSLVGILISRRRPIEGALLPLLALPTTYWILRPWSSFSPYLTSVTLAAVFLLLNARRRHPVSTALFASFLALAGAIRPDQLLYLYTISFITALVILDRSWRKIAAFHLVAATAAVFVTAWLNWQSTGDPLMSGYQIAARLTGLDSIRDVAFLPISTVIYAVAPAGIPGVQGIALAIGQYLFSLGPSWLLILVAAGLFPFLVENSRRQSRILLLILLAVFAIFAATRLGFARYGLDESVGGLSHDLPRYTALAYLFIGILVLLGLNSVHRLTRLTATIGVFLIAALGATYLISGDLPGSLNGQLAYRIQMQELSDDLSVSIPPDSILYSRTLDKIFVSRDFIVGTIYPFVGTDSLADSMLRAKKHGYQPFVTQIRPSEFDSLGIELAMRGEVLLRHPNGLLFYLQMPPGGT